MSDIRADEAGSAWIDELSDEQCAEVFWLYVDPPEPFLARHPPRLLGRALRHALKLIAAELPAGAPDRMPTAS